MTYFRDDEPVPGGVDVVFSFAAFRRFLQVPRQLSRVPAERRPTFVHWNTEGLVNLNVPYRLATALCAVRSGIWPDQRLARARARRHAVRVDVLWMGMRGTRRRSRILARLEEELDRRGVRFHVADGAAIRSSSAAHSGR